MATQVTRSLKAVIFDVDGTLAETERDGHLVAFNCAFEEHGLSWRWSPELYGELLKVTGGKERMAHFVARHRPPLPSGVALEALITALHASKTAHFVRLVDEGTMPLRPGVRRLINECRAVGMTMAIATTTTLANVEALIGSSLGPDAESWFQVIAAGDIVKKKKPAPDIFLWALEQLQLQPSECIAIEDSQNGLQASLAAGLPTLITVSFYTQQEQFAGAKLVLDHLGEPDFPATVKSGSLLGKSFVDIDLLTRLDATRAEK